MKWFHFLPGDEDESKLSMNCYDETLKFVYFGEKM